MKKRAKISATRKESVKIEKEEIIEFNLRKVKKCHKKEKKKG